MFSKPPESKELVICLKITVKVKFVVYRPNISWHFNLLRRKTNHVPLEPVKETVDSISPTGPSWRIVPLRTRSLKRKIPLRGSFLHILSFLSSSSFLFLRFIAIPNPLQIEVWLEHTLRPCIWYGVDGVKNLFFPEIGVSSVDLRVPTLVPPRSMGSRFVTLEIVGHFL